MNLDDQAVFQQFDPQGLGAQIEALPARLQSGWKAGAGLPLPACEAPVAVLIAGMGCSALAGELLAAYAAPICQAPVFVHREVGLPAWARGRNVLVIAISQSGDTEETLSAFESALAAGCCCLAVTAGGALARRAAEGGAALWALPGQDDPHVGLGERFGLLLAAFSRLNLIPDPASDLDEALAALRSQAASLGPGLPVARNPAKRLAGQLVGRGVWIFASGLLAPVARRWKEQINALAKAWSQAETLPGAIEATLAGSQYPEELFSRLSAVFLRAPADSPRNRLCSDLARRALMLEGIGTDFLDAQGASPLAQQWTALHFGEFVAYYLAMAYGADPAAAGTSAAFKEELKKRAGL